MCLFLFLQINFTLTHLDNRTEMNDFRLCKIENQIKYNIFLITAFLLLCGHRTVLGAFAADLRHNQTEREMK